MDGVWTYDADLPALRTERGHYSNMIKVKIPTVAGEVQMTRMPKPENLRSGKIPSSRGPQRPIKEAKKQASTPGVQKSSSAKAIISKKSREKPANKDNGAPPASPTPTSAVAAKKKTKKLVKSKSGHELSTVKRRSPSSGGGGPTYEIPSTPEKLRKNRKAISKSDHELNSVGHQTFAIPRSSSRSRSRQGSTASTSEVKRAKRTSRKSGEESKRVEEEKEEEAPMGDAVKVSLVNESAGSESAPGEVAKGEDANPTPCSTEAVASPTEAPAAEVNAQVPIVPVAVAGEDSIITETTDTFGTPPCNFVDDDTTVDTDLSDEDMPDLELVLAKTYDGREKEEEEEKKGLFLTVVDIVAHEGEEEVEDKKKLVDVGVEANTLFSTPTEDPPEEDGCEEGAEEEENAVTVGKLMIRRKEKEVRISQDRQMSKTPVPPVTITTSVQTEVEKEEEAGNDAKVKEETVKAPPAVYEEGVQTEEKELNGTTDQQKDEVNEAGDREEDNEKNEKEEVQQKEAADDRQIVPPPSASEEVDEVEQNKSDATDASQATVVEVEANIAEKKEDKAVVDDAPPENDSPVKEQDTSEAEALKDEDGSTVQEASETAQQMSGESEKEGEEKEQQVVVQEEAKDIPEKETVEDEKMKDESSTDVPPPLPAETATSEADAGDGEKGTAENETDTNGEEDTCPDAQTDKETNESEIATQNDTQTQEKTADDKEASRANAEEVSTYPEESTSGQEAGSTLQVEAADSKSSSPEKAILEESPESLKKPREEADELDHQNETKKDETLEEDRTGDQESVHEIADDKANEKEEGVVSPEQESGNVKEKCNEEEQDASITEMDVDKAASVEKKQQMELAPVEHSEFVVKERNLDEDEQAPETLTEQESTSKSAVTEMKETGDEARDQAEKETESENADLKEDVPVVQDESSKSAENTLEVEEAANDTAQEQHERNIDDATASIQRDNVDEKAIENEEAEAENQDKSIVTENLKDKEEVDTVENTVKVGPDAEGTETEEIAEPPVEDTLDVVDAGTDEQVQGTNEMNTSDDNFPPAEVEKDPAAPEAPTHNCSSPTEVPAETMEEVSIEDENKEARVTASDVEAVEGKVDDANSTEGKEEVDAAKSIEVEGEEEAVVRPDTVQPPVINIEAAPTGEPVENDGETKADAHQHHQKTYPSGEKPPVIRKRDLRVKQEVQKSASASAIHDKEKWATSKVVANSESLESMFDDDDDDKEKWATSKVVANSESLESMFDDDDDDEDWSDDEDSEDRSLSSARDQEKVLQSLLSCFIRLIPTHLISRASI